jgi:CheY-like chemotaxis protein
MVSNAIKYTNQGTIEITASVRDNIGDNRGSTNQSVVEFAVEDTGDGMTEEEVSQIFKPFVHSNLKVAHNYGGSGLCMVICKKLVDVLGGTMSVQSNPGRGTRMAFTIPCNSTKVELGPLATTQGTYNKFSSKRQTPSKHILIVEDNVINQRVLGKFLESVGHTYELANNGKEAVELWEQHKSFDLILMDVEMPEMNGLQATEQIRQKEQEQHLPPVPILGLSGNAREEQRVRALDSHMTGYLVKPYKKHELAEAIERCTSSTYSV